LGVSIGSRHLSASFVTILNGWTCFLGFGAMLVELALLFGKDGKFYFLAVRQFTNPTEELGFFFGTFRAKALP